MKNLLEGKTAWITGAAGAIGEDICHVFAREGARIILSGRNKETLNKVANDLPDSAEPLVLVVDVTNRAQVDDAASKAIAHFGRVDILVNSTTNPIFNSFQDLSDDDWMAVINAKTLGYMRTSRAIIPHMEKNGSGVIVNVSGRGGHQPNSPSHMAGSCANGAVNTLTKGLANIYGPKGIRVNAIAPGPVRTPRYDLIAAANKAIAEKNATAERSGAAMENPLGEMSEVRDNSDAVLYLASDMSRFITGTILQTDGGGTSSL